MRSKTRGAARRWRHQAGSGVGVLELAETGGGTGVGSVGVEVVGVVAVETVVVGAGGVGVVVVVGAVVVGAGGLTELPVDSRAPRSGEAPQ